jgi:hypothetical protein
VWAVSRIARPGPIHHVYLLGPIIMTI